MYEVGGELLKAVQSLYVDCKACIKIGIEVSEWFSVNVGVVHVTMVVQFVYGRGSE